MLKYPRSTALFLLVVALLLAACQEEAADGPTPTPEAAEAAETPVAEVPATGEETPEEDVPATGEGTPEEDVPVTGEETPEIGPTPEEADITPTPEEDGATLTPEPPDTTPTPEVVEANLERGEALYVANCAACHSEDGEGAGEVFPALAGNPFVTQGDPDQVIAVVLNGRGGMPRFSGALDNAEITHVVSYIRTAWQNDAEPISSDRVATLREQPIGEEDYEAAEERGTGGDAQQDGEEGNTEEDGQNEEPPDGEQDGEEQQSQQGND